MSLISIVIPNYNGSAFLKGCLDSLQNQTMKDFDICVVDDASTEESLQSLVYSYPRTRFIQRATNGGFAAAVNDGIRATDAPFIILLNNDATVASDFVEKLYKAIEPRPSCFSAQAKLVSMYNQTLIDDAGDFYSTLGWAFARGKGRSVADFIFRSNVFAACAGAAIYRREGFDKIGLFDEEHFCYLEDIDIGYRAKLYGFYNFYEPTAICYHAGSGTSGSQYNEFKVKLSARNAIYLAYKNQLPWQKVINAPSMWLGRIIKRSFFAKRGLLEAFNEGVKEGKAFIKTPEAAAHKVNFTSQMHSRSFEIEWEMIVGTLRRIFNF